MVRIIRLKIIVIVLVIAFFVNGWGNTKPDIHYSTKVAVNSSNSTTISYNQLLELNINNSKFIPKLVFRIGKFDYYSIPYEIKTAVLDSTTINNPSYIQVYLSNADCLDFLHRFYPIAVNAYNVLVPGTYKSDVARYCILDYYGGIYLDLSVTVMKKLEDIVRPTDTFVSSTDPSGKMFLFTGFIACTQGHPLMKIILHKIIDNVNSLYYGNNPLAITGPDVAGQGVNEFFGRHVNETIKAGRYHLKTPSKRRYKMRILSFEWDMKLIYERRKKNVCLRYKSTLYLPHYFELMFSNDTHYLVSWKERSVYNISNIRNDSQSNQY